MQFVKSLTKCVLVKFNVDKALVILIKQIMNSSMVSNINGKAIIPIQFANSAKQKYSLIDLNSETCSYSKNTKIAASILFTFKFDYGNNDILTRNMICTHFNVNYNDVHAIIVILRNQINKLSI